MDEFLTVDDVAELLKLNPQTIRNYVDCHELPAVRLGSRRVRIRRSDLDAFLAAGSAPDAGEIETELAETISETHDAIDRVGDSDVPARLRALADAATRLADALEGGASH